MRIRFHLLFIPFLATSLFLGACSGDEDSDCSGTSCEEEKTDPPDPTCEDAGTCEQPDSCGDGALDDGEDCDDGNGKDGDGCGSGCSIEAGYSCAGAPSVCELDPFCGDGNIDSGETCDDGNNTNGDCCSSTCRPEAGCEVEPNNPYVDGSNLFSSLAINDRVKGWIDPATDIDGYAFEVPAGKTGHVVLETLDGPVRTCASGDIDTRFVVYDSASNPIATDDDSGTSKCARIELFDLDPDVYVLAVDSGSSTTFDYTLSLVLDLSECGNGAVEYGETCDDGGVADGDACSSTCLAQCGTAGNNGFDAYGRGACGADCTTSPSPGPGADLTYCFLRYSDLTGFDLTDANFTGADLESANVSGVTALRATFVDAWARNIDLSSANLTDADFTGADITVSNFTAAVLYNTILTNSNPSGADMTNAVYERTATGNLVGCPGALGVSVQNGGGVSCVLQPGPNRYAILASSVVLTDLDMSGMLAAGADLAGARLDRSNLSGTDLSGARLANYISFVDADLSFADLSGANLAYGANFTRADLTNTDLTNTNLLQAILATDKFTNARLAGASIDEAVLDGADMTGAYGIPSLVDTCTAFYRGSKVTDLNLTGCTTLELDFSYAELKNAQFAGLQLFFPDFTHTDLTSANLSNTRVYGSTFNDADLSGADFTGSSLVDCFWSMTNLQWTDFTDATILPNASHLANQPINYDQAIYSNTTCPNYVNSDNQGGTCVRENGFF